jgi:hypothetical protein
VARAQKDGDLDEGEDAAQIAFELDAFLLMANMAFVLHNDRGVLDRARVAIVDRLHSVDGGTPASRERRPPGARR